MRVRAKIRNLFFISALILITATAYAESESAFHSQEFKQHLTKGMALLQTHKVNAAIKEFEQAVEIAPEAEAYYWLGYAYYLKSKSGDAESRALSRENFDRAYEIDPAFSPTPVQPEPAKK